MAYHETKTNYSSSAIRRLPDNRLVYLLIPGGTDLWTRGGYVSVLGVYGIPCDSFPLGQIFNKGIHLTFGQGAGIKYVDEPIRLLDDKKIRLEDIMTRRLPLSDAPYG